MDVHEEAGVGGVRRSGAGDVDLLDMIRLRTIAPHSNTVITLGTKNKRDKRTRGVRVGHARYQVLVVGSWRRRSH